MTAQSTCPRPLFAGSLARQYFLCRPTRFVEWPAACEQAELIGRIREAGERRPNDAYTRTFLRRYIAHLEERDIELVDALVEFYSDLVAVPISDKHSGSSTNGNDCSWMLVDLPLAKRHAHGTLSPRKVSTLQTTRMALRRSANILVGGGSTGHSCWDAAVLELGSGIGLAGITLALCTEARSVMLTDGDQSVVKMLRENVEANRSALRAPVSVQLLDWNVLLANGNKSIRCGRAVEMRGVNVADSGVLVEADVILAADCVYNPDTIPALVGALAILLKQMPMAGREPPVAHVVLTMRNPSTYASLLETLSHAGLVHNVRSADTVSDLAQSAPFHFVHDYDEDSIRWLEVRARADSPLVGVAAIR